MKNNLFGFLMAGITTSNQGGVVGCVDAQLVECTYFLLCGVQIPSEKVALAQKQMITKANIAGKFVITATQMLESMTGAPLPTRAEMTDVANAVWDGTDAVMLSGETAGGKFPTLAVQTMAAIVANAEVGTNSYQVRDNSRHELSRT